MSLTGHRKKPDIGHIKSLVGDRELFANLPHRTGEKEIMGVRAGTSRTHDAAQ
jgi:hypothetical protein